MRMVINLRKNSSPFLSGDFFADLCDVSLYESRFRQRPPSDSEITSARSIFCPSHHYERMIIEYGHLISAPILILGNSDRDFEGPLQELPSSVNKVYRQNSSYFDDKHRFIPIGIENLRLGLNGQIKYFSEKYFRKNKSSKVLVGPFKPTHSERNALLALTSNFDPDYLFLQGRLSPKDFAEIASGFRYVAAPRGNGLDTHRFWEALYRGSYPVVLKSKWSELISSMGLPIVEIRSWSVAELRRVANLELPNFNPKSLKALWADYWMEELGKED